MTGRNIPAEVIDAATKPVVRPFFAVDLELDDPNQLYFWSGIGDLTIGSVTYTGAGELLNVSDIRESGDISAQGATLSLSGIPSNLLTLALDEDYQNRICRIKFGLIDFDLISEGYLLLEEGSYLLLDADGSRLDLRQTQPASFFELFTGRLDQMNISDSGETATISVSVESKLIDLERARNRRYTDKAQQDRFAGDVAFEFVNRLQDEDLQYGP